MKMEKEAILTCSACGVEGDHELLYLSGHLTASRCLNCGRTQTYSGRIYTEYARDLAGRTVRLPGRFAHEMFSHPTGIASWPFKAARKPLGLLVEVDQISSFRRRRSPALSRHAH